MSEEVKLKRGIGLFKATLSGIGIILGAGIYALVGKAVGLAGNSVWISFVLAAGVASLSGLSYAELSSMFPKAGAEYTYTKEAFGRKLAFLVGFLIILSGAISSATVSLGFAGYLQSLLSTPLVPMAIILILALSFLIFYGIEESTWIAVAFTFIEAGGLILIVALGVPYFGSVNYFAMPSLQGLFGASALIFFAYLGFEEMVRLSEETENPTINIPKALILAIVITTILYILVGISAVSILDWQTLAASPAPLSSVASQAAGPGFSTILSVIALFATANTVLLMLLSASRITYGMAKSYSLPDIFGNVHPKTRTPWAAILMLAAVTILFVLPGEIQTVANLTNFTVFVTFLVVNISLIWLRYKAPEEERPFKVPLSIGKFPVLPALGLVTTIFLLFNIEISTLVYGVVLIVVGLILHRLLLKFS